MRRWFGTLSALCLLALGGLVAIQAHAPQDINAALHGFSTLLTVVTGLLSAVWWHQSADTTENPADPEAARAESRRRAVTLNAAAATTTGLAIIAGVYGSVAWDSLEGILAAGSFLVLLAMSMGELRTAALMSLRHGLHKRSALAAAVIVLAVLLFVARLL